MQIKIEDNNKEIIDQIEAIERNYAQNNPKALTTADYQSPEKIILSLKAFLFVFGSLIIIIFFNSFFPRKLQLIAVEYFRQIEQTSDRTANTERDRGGTDNS